MTKKRIVVMGFMAGIPIAGVIWQHIHYIVALQHLGHEVFYIEDSGRPPYDPLAAEGRPAGAYAVDVLDRLSRQFGFEDRWAFCPRYEDPSKCSGLPFAKVLELYREADAILNICGAQEVHEDLKASDRLIYIESDPGEPQAAIDNGDAAMRAQLVAHRARFTFGEEVPASRFPIPLNGIEWKTTRQPIVTDFWRGGGAGEAGRFTTIANWNTSGRKDIVWRGETYAWSKSLEFLKFIEAPRRSGETFELASNIADAEIRARFEGHGWRLSDAPALSLDIDQYRRFIQASKGEFTVAKDQYVRLNTGWFSDRSACYLAAGRPVITQDTAFERHIGGGAGLFGFRTLDDIAAAVEAINADYAFHSRAALEIAGDCFEATKVVGRLLDEAGI